MREKGRMINTCFLDLDGVIVDLLGGAMRLHGFVDPYSDPVMLGIWDFSRSKGKDFWEKMDENFWANLGWTEDGQQIIEILESRFGKDRICVLTTPTMVKGAMEGKARWIRKNLPGYRMLIGDAKELCARFDRILIDDKDANIELFREHQGVGLLVPRPWNSLHGTETLTYLKKRINEI